MGGEIVRTIIPRLVAATASIPRPLPAGITPLVPEACRTPIAHHHPFSNAEQPTQPSPTTCKTLRMSKAQKL